MNLLLATVLILSAKVSFNIGDSTLIQSNAKKKLSVVVFFTLLDQQFASLKKNRLKFLGFGEVTKVKPNSDKDDTNSEEDDEQGCMRSNTRCKEYLNNSLKILTRFCRTVMKMKTAVVSVSSKELTSNVDQSQSERTDQEALKRIRRLDASDKQSPQEPYLNDVLQPSIQKNVISNTKNVITDTKHTEVFQIRIKRNADASYSENENESQKANIRIKIANDVPNEKNSKTYPWDVLDIMQHVRYSFLGKIFDNTLKNQFKANQEGLVDMSEIGKVKEDHALFSTVKLTLDTVQETPEDSFLMVIFGGHLSAASHKDSPLVQSIKYVTENTEPENTLIIVTGSCAEDSNIPKRATEDNQFYTMPVYAKGPNSEMLSECTLLYDIPLTIRKIIETRCGGGLRNLGPPEEYFRQLQYPDQPPDGKGNFWELNFTTDSTRQIRRQRSILEAFPFQSLSAHNRNCSLIEKLL